MSAQQDNTDLPQISDQVVGQFIQRWENADGTEKANFQLFLTELCTALCLPQPDPAGSDNCGNAYVFERRVDGQRPDGSYKLGFADLYRRDCF
ncbi:MAG: hypothetical protein DRQ64_03965, partial [Gammaproteobacteria bacterium]